MNAASRPFVLVIDVGTTSVKAALVDGGATVVATGASVQRIMSDGSGRSEHDPALTWTAVRRAVDRLWQAADQQGVDAPVDIRAVAVTGPRGSFGLADATGRPIARMLTWQDRRAAASIPPLHDRAAEAHRAITGARLTASAVLPKLTWLRETDPVRFAPGWRIVTPQGEVLRRLGAGETVVDLTTAGHIGLLDVRRHAWSETLLARWDVAPDALPTLVEPGAIVGSVSRQGSRSLGVAEGVPLVAAGSDGVCSELGAGVVDAGQVYGYLGTAGAVAGPLVRLAGDIDPVLIVMPGSVRDRWRLLGLTGAGGSARTWAMDLLRVRDHARFDRLAASSPAGARGALFVAALAGAAAPEPDDRARGMLVGLSFVTGPPEIARAVLEGVGLEMRALVAAMAPALPRIEEVRFTGGGTRSMTWMRILADVLRLPVRRILEPNPGLRGAAQYAWTATGAFGGVLEAARALAPSSEVVDPDPAHEHRYAEAMDLYARVRRCAHQGGLDERLFEHAVDLAGSDRVG